MKFDWFPYCLLYVGVIPFCGVYFYKTVRQKYPRRITVLIYFLYEGISLALAVSAFSMEKDGIVWPSIAYLALDFVGLTWICWLLGKEPFRRILLLRTGALVLAFVGWKLGALLIKKVLVAVESGGIFIPPLWERGGVVLACILQNILFCAGGELLGKRHDESAPDVRWATVAIVILTQLFAQILLTYAVYGKYTTLRSVGIMGGYLLICVVADIYVVVTLHTMARNADLREQVSLLNQQQALEKKRYEAAGEQLLSIRRLRHDYLNTISTIGTLLEMQQDESIREILSDTQAALERNRVIRTGSPVVDAVLYSKQAEAKEKGIDFRCKILWTDGLSISDTDLMRLFSNLLDDAVALCLRLPEEGERLIEMDNVLRGELMAVTVTIPYLEQESSAFPAKGVADGLAPDDGISMAREIAERNGGVLTMERRQGHITIRLLLVCGTQTPKVAYGEERL